MHSSANPARSQSRGEGAARAILHGLRQPWRKETQGGLTVWRAGWLQDLPGLARAVSAGDWPAFERGLRAENGQFGLILRQGDMIIAAADRISGHPLFVREGAEGGEIAADSRVWLTPDFADDMDAEQRRLFGLAGYCIGRKTLLRGVTRVLPGEYVILDGRTGTVERCRYYRFLPDFPGKMAGLNEAAWRERLGAVLDNATRRMIEQADGGTIWLALSAGYDSRVLLAKLIEHKYPDIQTFSYGTRGNMEAKVARDLAAAAGVPWRFVSSRADDVEDYWQGEAARYLYCGGGAHVLPAMTEFHALQRLAREGQIREGDLVTNGQSGDYLTGAHIPADTSADGLARFTRRKHFAYSIADSEAFGDDGVGRLLGDWSSTYLAGDARTGQAGPLARYLAFEWQERQSRYVVNQQRAHDYLGLRWTLPLWDGELMDLFEEAPLELHTAQRLYLGYLTQWNHAGLFDELRLPYEPWNRWKFPVQTMARLAGVIGGRRLKSDVYSRLYYFSDHHYLNRYFGWRGYQALRRDGRMPSTLLAMDYLLRVLRSLGLEPESEMERLFADTFRDRLESAPRCADTLGD